MKYNLEIRCSVQTRDEWDALYIGVPEHSKVPYTGFPEWHYEWNYCLDCSSSLMFCRNNPYNHFSEYARNLRDVITESPRPEVIIAETRVAKKQKREEEDERLKGIFREAYLRDETVSSIAKEYGMPVQRVSHLLKSSGVKIVRGRTTKLLTI